MFKKYNTILMTAFYCLDISFTLAALQIAYLWSWLRGETAPGSAPNVYSYLVVILIWGIIFRLFALYKSKRAVPLVSELLRVSQAVFVSWMALVAWAFLLDGTAFSRPVLVRFGVIDLALLIAFHLLLRLVLRFLRAMNYNMKNVLIVGAGRAGQQVALAVQERPWAGYQVLGFLDNDSALTGSRIKGTPVLGDLGKIRAVAETMQVDDEVIITLPPGSHGDMVSIIRAIEDIPVNVRVVPDLYSVASIRPMIEDLWGIPLIGIRQPAVIGPAEVAKRLMDMVGGVIGLILCAPAMLLISLLVRLDSRGPVFYRQERVGENGRPFTMYKFRTMVVGAEEMLPEILDVDKLEEPVFKIRDDPRVTRFGHFLRRSSLDELPQLFNVLKGEMSLVGPRPEETRMVRRYSSWHRKRLMVKPGMTGPVQVGGRGDLPLSQRVQMEVDYISEYSLWTDLKILIRTIPAVIKGDGSY